ncbi:unnamed protein product [Leptidea sinapis]|uniref:alpha-glucosidase n=1 Tax=Leptidea sinapis TaxID=189913 RepID=A0A5E4R237_9NEOP|nr:unnamed protein product [Leptidea sinapis]
MKLILVLTVTIKLAIVSATDTEWWKTALIYQIYPRSFKDSDGDGIGDLTGIKENLPYLKSTGVDGIWLSPIFLSPMRDFGYDITDYRQIAPEYGTMKDFQELLKEARKLGLRVILDFVPNHTSNESDWFIRSARREPGYEDFYVWADGIVDPERPGEVLPPSNWVSHFRRSMWEYHPGRGQYYLHQFAIGQPDLNYRSQRVQAEMKEVLRFWLDLGVSGFRVDAINKLYEVDPNDYGGVYPDEPLSGISDTDPDDYEYYDHIFTQDLAETYEVVFDWREVLDEYTETHGEYKIMMTEAYTNLFNTILYYGNENRDGAIPFNFIFLEEINKNSTARDIKTTIDKWMTYMPHGRVANWVNGNHDQSRLASRQGPERVDAMNMLALMLPGVALTYQGEEIGMTDGHVSWEDTKDPQACNTDDPINYWKKSRDPSRTPYHWDSSVFAGFTCGVEPWLPVADNYKELNLQVQLRSRRSHYNFYKDVVAVRKTAASKYGDLGILAYTEDILVVTRLLPNARGIVGVINLSNKPQLVDLSSVTLLPKYLKVVASGVNCTQTKGFILLKDYIIVSNNCALLLQTISRCC